MRLMKSLLIFSVFIILLNSCSSLGEAGKVIRNEKRTTTDEFLIKKKNPLTQPPDYGKMLEPETKINKADKSEDNIQKILKSSQSQSTNPQNKTSSTEESIINNIKK
jgi:hypothetical protein|tara:strand:- start:150 stop:470 length:321 start_codon:yes stop_codon:yes gene_type:complete